MRARLVPACDFELKRQTDFSEPRARFNTEPASRLVPGWSEGAAWAELVGYYREQYRIPQ